MVGRTQTDFTRRAFLTGARTPAEETSRPRPPGVSDRTLSACTGCGACETACPEDIIEIADGHVAVDFTRGECTFCGACAEACPEPVFEDGVGMEHEVRIGDGCLVHAGIACMTCRDACPEQAISMRPRIGLPFLPVLDPSVCTGCGACIAPCPVDAIETLTGEEADA